MTFKWGKELLAALKLGYVSRSGEHKRREEKRWGKKRTGEGKCGEMSGP